MKFKLLLAVSLLCSPLFSQVMMGNYPIQQGNLWVYRNYSDPFGSPLILTIIDSTVNIDSMIYNVIEYRSSWDTMYKFIRFDTTSNYAVSRLDDNYPTENHEYKYFKLAANLGDDWVVPNPAAIQENLFIEIFDSIPAFMFGEWTYIEQYYIHDSIFIYNYGEFWNPDFGMSSNANDQGEPVNILSGCVIDGVVYGDTNTVVGIKELDKPVSKFHLEQNYPNPFNPSTIISYSIPESQRVTIRIFDALGKEVFTLVDKELSSGNYQVKFEAHNLSSGIYFYQMITGTYSSTKKMLLAK